MTVRSVRQGIVAALMVLLAAACSDGAGARPDPTPDQSARSPASTGDGPVLAHPEAGSGYGSAALIAGRLTMSGGCLMIDDEYPVIWPYGTTWDAGRRAVVLPGGEVANLGERVTGGGGFPYLTDLESEVARRLADCPLNQYEEVARFNARERVTVGD